MPTEKKERRLLTAATWNVAQTRQYLEVVRQQPLAVDPGVSARSSTRPRRRCVLAASAHDGTSLEDDGVVERHWWQSTNATPAFRTLHALDGVASSARRPPVQLRFTATTVGRGDEPDG